MPGVVVLHSGGQDSTTCLAWAIEKWGHENVHPVSFFYQQRHSVELDCAREICTALDVPQPYLIEVSALKQFGAAALTNPKIEVASDARGSGNVFAAEHDLPSTFVPGRNMIFLTLALAYGAQRGIYDLVTGVCEADDAGYPDCRAEFIDAAQDALSCALDERIGVHAPLLDKSKARTFKLAEELDVLELVIDKSHTCYEGVRSNKHDWGRGCGLCPACLERAKGWDEYLELGAPTT